MKWCFHDRLREHTFADGTTIKMCPDCTQFDSQRNAALRVGRLETPTAQVELHWREVLDQAGLCEHIFQEKWLSTMDGRLLDLANTEESPTYFDLSDGLKKLYEQRRLDAAKRKTALDGHEWIERAKPFPHTLAMPRAFRAFCVHCVDVVLSNKKPWVIRHTKGVYLPIEHECHSVRVYNLQGTLLEVKNNG